jgi:hypothetical protein
MSFLPSLASVSAVIAAVSIGAAGAIADPIPGPPLPVSASDRAGAFCPLPASGSGNAAGFAAGVLFAAIAGRRRAPRA